MALSKQLDFLICMHIHCSATNIVLLVLLYRQIDNLPVFNSMHEHIPQNCLAFVAAKSNSSALCILIYGIGKCCNGILH